MKTKMRKSVLLVTGIIFFSANAIFAQPGRGLGPGQGLGPGYGFNQGQWPGGGFWMNQLDLTEQQKESIADLRTGHIKTMTDLRNQMREKRAQLRTVTTGDNYDKNNAERLIGEIGELHASILKERTGHRQDVRNILNEEQQAIFDAHAGRGMRGSMARNKRWGGWGRGYGRGYGPCWRAN